MSPRKCPFPSLSYVSSPYGISNWLSIFSKCKWNILAAPVHSNSCTQRWHQEKWHHWLTLTQSTWKLGSFIGYILCCRANRGSIRARGYMQTGSFNYTHAPKEPWVTAHGFALVSSDRVWPPWSHAWSRNVGEAAAPRLQGAGERPEHLPEQVGVDRQILMCPLARGPIMW